MEDDLMRLLARRSGLSKKFGLCYVEGPWPHLEVDHPAGVARLIGEAKKQVDPGRVFLRGQVEQHHAMLPGLFRANKVDPNTLKEAERELADRIRHSIPVKRFESGDLPALLQHYGFRTSWLDAVDNFFVAAWFGANELLTTADCFIEITPSSKQHGWLFLIATRAGSRQLRHVDLRIEHHALSSRPHIQHGISLTGFDSKEYDLRDFVVGTVRFPISRYTTTGALFESSFLFPGTDDDHTLRLLVKHRVNDIAAAVEKKYELSDGTLGRVSRLRCTA
ncbi:MAG: FRG domain-containing protein [Acidobacteria bacterium]|nr:FRG domain-containing protein [Acidobacteriota bacterium]